jgi:2-haloacid dehalogenase
MRVNRRDFIVGAMATGPALAAGRAVAADANAQGSSPSSRSDQSVELLVFDVFGTVVDWRSSVIAEGEKLGNQKGLSIDWAQFADDWRGAYGPSMNRVRRGEVPWTKLDNLHRQSLDGLLVKYKITNLTEDEKVHFNRVWHRLKPWPDSPSGLTRLKKRFVISPLSNGNVSLLTNMGKHAGLPWDCVLATELVKHYKPDPETYLMPGEFFDLPPARVMMVAAHAGDLDAAKKLGLKTAYVHRPLEFGPKRTPSMPETGRYDYMAKDFRDLARQLGV